MPWGAVAGAAIVAGGSYLASQSASDAAEAQANALREQGNIEYARAQEAAGRVPEFRPVTVTSSFGTPKYTYDESGRLTGVEATPAPWLQSLQTRGQGLAGQYLGLQESALGQTAGQEAANRAFAQSGTLYNLANQALPQSYDVTQATQDYYNRMQQLVAPERERQLATTRQGLFNVGRTGLAIGATQAGGQLATNPEMAAYYNAIAQQDLNLANQAEQQALANLTTRQNLGTGLLTAGTQQTATGGTALNQYYGNIAAAQAPYTSGMAQLSSLESMVNLPVTQGMSYGANVTNQANAIADAYLRASGAGSASKIAAINAQAQADAYNPWASALMGAGQAIGGTNWSGLLSSGGGGGTSQPSYNQAVSNYGSGNQMFSNVTPSGFSYGGFNTSGRLY